MKQINLFAYEHLALMHFVYDFDDTFKCNKHAQQENNRHVRSVTQQAYYIMYSIVTGNL